MRVIVYHNSRSKIGQRLHSIIAAAHLEVPVEYHHTLADFLDTLARLENSRSILVIQASDRQTIDECIFAGDWWSDFQVVLILPDQRAETISKGHLLCPRFVTFANADLNHLGSVLEKLVSLSRRKLGVY